MTQHQIGRLQIKETPDTTAVFGSDAGAVAMVAPVIDEDYWVFRVEVSESQAVVGFPKFGTIGIGFQVEEDDWNTNLPYTSSAEEILAYIGDNKGDSSISDESCLEAIRLIQAAASKYLGHA